MSSRRTCKSCSAIYNILTLKPKKEGICNICGGELIQRGDDNPESIKKRFREFEEKTKPVLEHYKEKGVLSSYFYDKLEITPEEHVEKILKIIRGC